MSDIIDAHIEWMQDEKYEDNSINDRRWLLHRLDRELPAGVELALPTELKVWFNGLRVQPRTISTYHNHVIGFYGWAADPADPWLDYDPSAGLVRPKLSRTRPRPAATEQLFGILARSWEPFRTWITIGAYQGARCIEIARLDREHITERSMTLIGKRRRVREVPTDEVVWDAVRHLPGGPIARMTRSGRRASAEYVSARLSKHFRKELRIPVKPHQLRHWFGTYTCQTAGIRVTQELMGHESPVSTAIYTEVSEEQMRSAVAALPRFAPQPMEGHA